MKANIDEHKDISDFFQHCCQMGHYTFDILKCGKETCKLCRPIRLPRDVFDCINSCTLAMMDITAPSQRSLELLRAKNLDLLRRRK